MFGINKKDLVSGLQAVGRKCCCYDNPSRCDCKYGITYEDRKFEGERTGCPEISQAAQIIAAMDEEEFLLFCNRAKIILSGFTVPSAR